MTFTVTNTGDRAGADVPQLYLTEPREVRLLGFERVELAPGESRTVTITAEPRVLAPFGGGPIAVSSAADAPVLTGRL